MTVTDLKQMIMNRIPEDKNVQEIRIRVGSPVFLQVDGREVCMDGFADVRLVRELLEICSNHSLYAYEEELRQGFITIEGGHRVGISGKVVLEGRQIRTIKDVSALNIRLACERKGCAEKILPFLYVEGELQNTLFISPPGGGKTTLLRDTIRMVSDGNPCSNGKSVSVVDERSEIGACFRGIPQCDLGQRTDIMDGCPKSLGMQMMIRSMGPDVLAADEIGTEDDVHALRDALKSGVRILATVHGETLDGLKQKRFLSEIIEERMFERYVILGRSPIPGTILGIYDQRGAELSGGYA